MMGYNSNQRWRACWENENRFTRGNDAWGMTQTPRRVRQKKCQRASRHAASSSRFQKEWKTNVRNVSRSCLQGPVLRLTLVVTSLLLNPTNNMRSLQLVGGRKYMWIPMVPSSTRRVGMLTSRVKSSEIASAVSVRVPASNKNRHGYENNDDDGSTWWLTHRLFLSGSHQSPTTHQSPTRKWNSHTSNKKQDSNQTEWALTRALIPRRFQHPTSGDNTPVPGKPPTWHT
jgi:hypothetical protein